MILDEADRMFDMGFEPQVRVGIHKIFSGEIATSNQGDARARQLPTWPTDRHVLRNFPQGDGSTCEVKDCLSKSPDSLSSVSTVLLRRILIKPVEVQVGGRSVVSSYPWIWQCAAHFIKHFHFMWYSLNINQRWVTRLNNMSGLSKKMESSSNCSR